VKEGGTEGRRGLAAARCYGYFFCPNLYMREVVPSSKVVKSGWGKGDVTGAYALSVIGLGSPVHLSS
jgi:hypothetical protein